MAELRILVHYSSFPPSTPTPSSHSGRRKLHEAGFCGFLISVTRLGECPDLTGLIPSQRAASLSSPHLLSRKSQLVGFLGPHECPCFWNQFPLCSNTSDLRKPQSASLQANVHFQILTTLLSPTTLPGDISEPFTHPRNCLPSQGDNFGINFQLMNKTGLQTMWSSFKFA